jgi:hypothetical protein
MARGRLKEGGYGDLIHTVDTKSYGPNLYPQSDIAHGGAAPWLRRTLAVARPNPARCAQIQIREMLCTQ